MAKEKKAVQLDANGFRKFGMRDCLAYAAGDFGCNMSFALKGTMAIFWTQFMQMDLWYSLLLIVVQVWDAINDPIIGSMVDADKHKYKRNKFLQYIWFGSIGLIVGGACCFLPFPNAPTWAKAIIFIAGYVIWDAFYTVANVPYGSLLSLISNEPADRASLSAWRSVGSMVGGMIPGIILPMFIWQKVVYDGTEGFLNKIVIPKGFTKEQFFINPVTKEPYQIGDKILSPETGKQVEILLGERVFWVALVMGVLGFIAFMFMLKNITVRVDENSVKANEQTEKFNVFKAFGKFLKNRPAVGATVAAMGMFLGMQGGTAAVTVLFQSYFNNVKISGLVSMFAMIPIVIFTPLARKLVVKYGKKELSTVGALVSVIACVAMLILPITPDGKGLAIYVVCQFFFSIGMGIYSTVSWSLMGDAIDYNEWKNGTREEGTVYSLHSFFRKLAQGVGPSAVMYIMGLLGYVSKYGTIGQSAETAKNMCWLVAGLYLFSALVQFVGIAVIYNLDKKTLAQMNEELAERHERADKMHDARKALYK